MHEVLCNHTHCIDYAYEMLNGNSYASEIVNTKCGC